MAHDPHKFTQGLNTPVLALIAAVGAITVVVVVVGVQAYYEAALRAEEQVKRIQPEYQPLAELRERQRSNLTTVGWTDREAGIAHLPIEEGKRLVIAAYGGGAAEDETHEAPEPEHPTEAHRP